MGIFKDLKSFNDTNQYYCFYFFENENNHVALGRIIRQISTDHK